MGFEMWIIGLLVGFDLKFKNRDLLNIPLFRYPNHPAGTEKPFGWFLIFFHAALNVFLH